MSDGLPVACSDIAALNVVDESGYPDLSANHVVLSVVSPAGKETMHYLSLVQARLLRDEIDHWIERGEKARASLAEGDYDAIRRRHEWKTRSMLGGITPTFADRVE